VGPHAHSSRLPSAAGLKKFLSKHVKEDSLAVLDKKLGGVINEKMGINIVFRWGGTQAAWVAAAEGSRSVSSSSQQLCAGGQQEAVAAWAQDAARQQQEQARAQASGARCAVQEAAPSTDSPLPHPTHFPCCSNQVNELARGVRYQLQGLIR
jgi:hypothetical protein